MVSDAVLWDAVSVPLMGQHGFLPLTEAVQRFIGMVIDLQVRLQQKKAVTL